MHDFSHRAAVAALFIAGVLMAVSPWLAGDAEIGPGQLLLSCLGLGVIAAAALPVLRAAALGGAILSKLLLLFLVPTGAQLPYALEASVLALLLGAAAILVREAWQQARWDGVLPLRQEW